MCPTKIVFSGLSVLKKEIIWTLYKIEEMETKEFLSNQISKEKNLQVLQEIIWFLFKLKSELSILCDLINDFEKLNIFPSFNFKVEVSLISCLKVYHVSPLNLFFNTSSGFSIFKSNSS